MLNTPESEIAALLTGAALAPIRDRAFLRVTGEDRTRWLNGMVTNSTQALKAGEGNENFLLNAQGRIQGSCTVWCESEEFLIETTKSQVAAIQQHLDRFIIMDDVELIPVMDDQLGLLVAGPRAADRLSSLSLPAPAVQHLARATYAGKPVIVFAAYAALIPSYEIWGAKETIAAIQVGLDASAVVSIGEETVEQLRVLSAAPLFGRDIHDRDLPQETAQNQTLHFNKGCYLGQEIVERIRSRGQVHRTFSAFRLDGSVPLLPAAILAAGKPVGELTSATTVRLPSGEVKIALGFVRREALETHQVLTYEGGTASKLEPQTFVKESEANTHA